MHWVYLGSAIVFEVVGTMALKLSEGWSRLAPTLVMALAYMASFFFLGLCLKKIDVSVAYAVWCGIGMMLIAVGGVMFFKEPVTPLKTFSLVLIVAGVVGLKLTG